MGLYKQYKPQFDEILFVASHGLEERIDSTLCDYDNVLCLESDELVFAVGGEGQVVRSLTAKFRSRFEVSPYYCDATHQHHYNPLTSHPCSSFSTSLEKVQTF